MKKMNLIFAGICAVLGVLLIVLAAGYPTAADYGTGVPGPGLWRRAAAAAAGDPPGSPSVRAVLEEGSRHIGAKGEGALQTPRESGGGGGPGLGLGGVDRAGARKAGE